MKKVLLSVILSGTICLGIGAATGSKITSTLIQQPIVSNGVTSIKQVISYNNSTYVPLREFANMTGTSVDYKNGKIYLGANNTVEEPVQQNKKKFTFTINGIITGKVNYEDKEIVIANVTMFNNSGKSVAPYESFYSIKAYQNGIELEQTMADIENDKFRYVMNGASLEYGNAFIIKDNSPVTIEISEVLGEDKVSKTFKLQ